MKTKTPNFHHGVWGSHSRRRLYIFIHLLKRTKTQHRDLHQVPGGGSTDLDREGWLLEDTTSGNKTLHHAPQAGEKFDEHITLKIWKPSWLGM